MGMAKKVEMIEAEVARLEARIRVLNDQARGIGHFLECAPKGGMDEVGCGCKVFVRNGQNPPADWMSYHDYDFGPQHVCGDCARKHKKELVDWGYEQMGKTRSQKRRDALRRKRQKEREATLDYWQEQVVFTDPVTFTAYLGTRLEMAGAYFAAGRAEEAVGKGSPPDLRYVDSYSPGTVYNPLLTVPPEFGGAGLEYLAGRRIAPR